MTPSAVARAPAAYLHEDETLAYEYAGLEGAKLGVTLPRGAVKFLDIQQASSPQVLHGSALAYTSCSYANEEVIGCELQIGTRAHTQHELKATVAHEVFHAFQAVMCGRVRECHAQGFHWLVEGSAEWAAVQATGADSTSRHVLARYFNHPSRALFNREYDAIGFFNHMQSVGISPWTRFKTMFRAPNQEAAYVDAIGGDDEAFLQTEASVFFRDASGWPWAERPDARLFREGELALTGGVTGAKVELVARKSCEALLPARSCERLLPEYSDEAATTLETVGKHFEPPGKFSKIEANSPDVGFSSSTCLFLFKGTIGKRALPTETNAEGEPEPTSYEEFFEGAIASGVNVSRYESAAAAKSGFEITLRASSHLGLQSVKGVGEEAWLSTKEASNANGEEEYPAPASCALATARDGHTPSPSAIVTSREP
jgi:hypothetical protein